MQRLVSTIAIGLSLSAPLSAASVDGLTVKPDEFNRQLTAFLTKIAF